jgi:hypothetical protein
MKLQDRIAHREFFQQIEEAIRRLKEKLFLSEEEKALDAQSERFLLAKKIILFQATPDDLKTYEAEKLEIQADLEGVGLRDALDLGLNFYETAKKRDEIFFNKVTTDPKLSKENIAVVTGGFHTEGLSQRMKEAGISYIVITPGLAEEAPNEELYFQRLQIGPRMPAQALAPYNEFLEPPFDAVRSRAALKEFDETNNLLKAKAIAEGEEAFLLGPPVTAPGAVPTGLSFEDFLELPRSEQIGQLKKWAQTVETGQPSILIILPDDVIEEWYRLKGFDRDVLEKDFLPNKSNSATILGTNFPSEILGEKAKIFIEPAVENVEQFLELPGARKRLVQFPNRLAGIQGELLKQSPILIFPVKIGGEPFRGILLIVGPILRAELRFSTDPNVQSQFFARVQELLSEYKSLEDLLRAA